MYRGEAMPTRSISRNFEIKTIKDATDFMNAIKISNNLKTPVINISKPVRAIQKVEIKEFFNKL